MQNSKQVLVIDDHPLVLDSIKSLVEDLCFDVVTAIDAGQALDKLNANPFDLILLDIGLPDIDGKSLLKLIRMNYEKIPVLIVSGVLETQEVMWMLEHGAQGYIDKAAPSNELSKAIIEVINGGSYMPYEIKSAVNTITDKKEAISSYVGITGRQKEIIGLLAEGMSNKQIAAKLGIAESTVASHFKHIFPALGVHNRTACANVAKELGII